MAGGGRSPLCDARQQKLSGLGLGFFPLGKWDIPRIYLILCNLSFSQSWCLKNCLANWQLLFCMPFMCRKLSWHFGMLISLYTHECKAHTLQPLRVTAQDVRAWTTSIPATSKKRCSDKSVLFAVRFKIHAAKTTSVFRSSEKSVIPRKLC